MPFPAPATHLDVVAQHAGFPDYATWQAWNQHRTDAITQGSHTVQGDAPAQQNWLQRMIANIPIHPASIFQHISDAYGDATGQGRQ